MAAETFKLRETPWWTFYTHPRSTFERILSQFPEAYGVMMALVAGFGMLLQHLFSRGLTTHNIPGAIYLEAFIFGPIFGLACYFFAGWIFTVLGNRLGGQGSMARNRAVWAWSFVPFLTGLVFLWIPLTIAAVTRAQLHSHMPDSVNHLLLYLEIFFYYAFVPFWGWTIYLLVLGISVANRFTLRQAVLLIVFSYVIIGAVIWLLFMAGHLTKVF